MCIVIHQFFMKLYNQSVLVTGFTVSIFKEEANYICISVISRDSATYSSWSTQYSLLCINMYVSIELVYQSDESGFVNIYQDWKKVWIKVFASP